MNKKSDCQKNQRIQVFARCRPLNSIEKKQCSPSVLDVIPEKKIIVKDRNANREFLFDKVFPPDTKQISVYKSVVEPLIQEVLMGYNCTVFAYGQTGTGKTYTMEGERNDSHCSWEDDPGAGIIPRSLHQLFEDLNKGENVEFSVRISFLELYNEELFDLLSTNELSRLRLFEDSSKKGSVIIQGLEEIVVNSKDEVYSILEKGTARRQTAATMLNASSSRSHTVFSVTVHIKENTIEGEELLKTGKLNLVDLAGSENVGRSGAVDKRAREAGNINQSLLTLGRVITALIEKQPHVPYRESKLTRLLQDSLGGHTKTSIIATVSPAQCNFDETISTLDYATKAKSITIRPEINQKMTKRALIREYTEEIERLRKDLAAVRNKEGFYIDSDNYTTLLAEMNEKNKLIKDMSDKIDILKEENAKIEEIFNLTKEELNVACEKLDQTSKKFEKTAAELSNTTSALSRTQQVLTEKSLESDERQFLINIQKDTENKLSQQAQKLILVADETTNDVEKLHAKIYRKSTVENTNEERLQDFRKKHQKQLFSMLENLVSKSEEQQDDLLSSTKDDMDKLIMSVEDFKQQNNSFLNEIVSLVSFNNGNLSTYLTSEKESDTKWMSAYLAENKEQKDAILEKFHCFLRDKIPKLVSSITSRNAEMEKWILDVHTKLSEQVERKKQNLLQNSEERKQLLKSVNESLESLCRNYENSLEGFRQQLSRDRVEEENIDENFSSELEALRASYDKQCASFNKQLSSIEEIAKRNREKKKDVAEHTSSFVSNVQQSALNLREKIQEPLKAVQEYEETLIDCVSTISQLPSIVNIEEFSEKQECVHNSQQMLISENDKFLIEQQKDQETMFLTQEASLNSRQTTMSKNIESIQKIIAEADSGLEKLVCSKKPSLLSKIEDIDLVIHKAQQKINESKTFLNSSACRLKDEILQRDLEFEKFITDDLLKDVPTGITPQRKNYCYPRYLAATSPHERVLQRYRSQLATDTSIAIDLPLNSSFNELEESDVSPASSEKAIESVDALNLSFLSDCSVDSCNSTMSDASTDSTKNKENRAFKKTSRLPKKLPATKDCKDIFIKPAPWSLRKPFSDSNINHELS